MGGGFEALWKILGSIDLVFVGKILSRRYRPDGTVGRHYRKLLGMLKADLVKRFTHIESYRQLLAADKALQSL